MLALTKQKPLLKSNDIQAIKNIKMYREPSDSYSQWNQTILPF